MLFRSVTVRATASSDRGDSPDDDEGRTVDIEEALFGGPRTHLNHEPQVRPFLAVLPLSGTSEAAVDSVNHCQTRAAEDTVSSAGSDATEVLPFAEVDATLCSPEEAVRSSHEPRAASSASDVRASAADVVNSTTVVSSPEAEPPVIIHVTMSLAEASSTTTVALTAAASPSSSHSTLNIGILSSPTAGVDPSGSGRRDPASLGDSSTTHSPDPTPPMPPPPLSPASSWSSMPSDRKSVV